jgi:TRAP-type transport system periplasmic protein
VVTRSRDVATADQFSGLKIRTIQSAIYVKAVELMGASPTPMAFGEVYTSLQTGVIDGYEHDASTTLQQRFYEVAKHMTRTRHIAGVLGLWASTIGLERLPAELRAPISQAAKDAALTQRAMGPSEDTKALAELKARGMTIREFDNTPFRPAAERLWQSEARALGVESWLEAILA